MKLTKILGIVALLSASLFAQPAHNEQVLPNSGGDAVSMDKEWAVVGDKDNNIVYIYKLDYSNFQWVLDSNISVTANSSQFGASVALHGDYLAVGQPLFGSADKGRVRVYEVNATGSWNKIQDKQGADGDFFGTSVAVHDNGDGTAEIAVGAPDAFNPHSVRTGVVYT